MIACENRPETEVREDTREVVLHDRPEPGIRRRGVSYFLSFYYCVSGVSNRKRESNQSPVRQLFPVLVFHVLRSVVVAKFLVQTDALVLLRKK